MHELYGYIVVTEQLSPLVTLIGLPRCPPEFPAELRVSPHLHKATTVRHIFITPYPDLSKMGKSQTRKKTQAWRHNPIRVPDAHLGHGKVAGQGQEGKESQLLPILGKVGLAYHRCSSSVPRGDLAAVLPAAAKCISRLPTVGADAEACADAHARCSSSRQNTPTGPGRAQRSAT
jgi:hypothetical protein